MGNMKIVGLDGKPLPVPSKENPQGLAAAQAALNQTKTIAHIDLLPNGTFGLRALIPMPPMDFAFVLSELLFNLMAAIRQASSRPAPGPEEPKGGKDDKPL